MIIQISKMLISVDGVKVASTFTGFAKWVMKNKVNISEFENWPIIVGLSSDLETKKVHFYL